MRNIAVAAVLGFSAVLAACSDTPADNKGISTDISGPMMGKKTNTGACSSTQAALVEADQAVLFAGATLNDAQALWRNVKQDCSTTNTARMATAQDALMEYIRFTILVYRDNPSAILPTDNSAAIVGHWNLAFPYVGYLAPGVPSDMLEVGAARVISRSQMAADSVEFGIPAVAAMRSLPQVTGGDPRGHLFVIFPVTTANCNPQSALAESTACFNFKAFPSAPAGFNPRIRVGICYSGGFDAPGLAHYNGSSTTIEPTITYPSSTFCHNANAPRYGSTGFFGRVSRLASTIFGVKRAYAAHGGLGTLAPGFSTFVPVERNLFTATFGTLDAGDTPAEGELPAPDRGFWTEVFSTSPGSIFVRDSLGNLNTKPVVLNQGGGACNNNCGGLSLIGQIKTADASGAISGGSYYISWTSVQNHASPKNAPFVIRGSDSAEIARVAYARQQGGNKILYNGSAVKDAGWTKGQAQTFILIIDFVNGTTTLTVKNSAGDVVATATDNFVEDATDLSQIAAEFSEIDSGIVGWDNVIIERLPDSE